VRFSLLGSGSRGNATLIAAGDSLLLVDCGFSLRETTERLARLNVAPNMLTAILVTHEHDDHVSGVGALARKHDIPVWLTGGTLRSAAGPLGELPTVRVFSNHDSFAIGDICIQPVAVPHDACEPCQFVFGDGDTRVGLLTDVGHVTPHIRRMVSGVHALLVEFNHDETMLRQGPYPESLKQRIGGALGHLSNDQSATLLNEIDVTRLQHLVALHLSQQNNHPDIVRQTAAAALGCTPDWIAVADQDLGQGWCEVMALR
jgi:phosphoribosyl 1,2-cyclic phosphodiesterase